MKTEKISWKSDGIRIVGETFRPTHRNPPFPALIICHGIPAKVKGPEDGGYPVLAERFCRAGFFVLIFNFRGAGSSEGNFDILGWARDLEGALDFSLADPVVDRRPVWVMGFSGGGAVAIYVAAHRSHVAGLVSCASPAEFKDVFSVQGGKDLLAYSRDVGIIRDPSFPPSVEEWQNHFKTIAPLRWVDRIPPRPLLILQGTQDDVVPVDHGRRLYERVKGKAELFLIEGGGHRLRVDEEAMHKAEEWLIKKVTSENV